MGFERDLYIKRHRWSGLKVGDKVRVFRTADSYEADWRNTWEPTMTDMVDKESVITEDFNECGFHLKSGYSYPWFVLQNVEDTEADTE